MTIFDNFRKGKKNDAEFTVETTLETSEQVEKRIRDSMNTILEGMENHFGTLSNRELAIFMSVFGSTTGAHIVGGAENVGEAINIIKWLKVTLEKLQQEVVVPKYPNFSNSTAKIDLKVK